MKVAFVIGHNTKEGKGYKGRFGMTEYDFHKKVASDLEIDCFEFNPKLNYFQGCRDVNEKLKGYDLVLHLHFNSYSDNGVGGCESLYWHKNNKGKRIAEEFIDFVTEEYGTRKRRAVPMVDNSQRGYYAVKSCPITCIILEPFFGSNNNECKLFSDTERYAKVLTKFVDKINGNYSK